ncbi:hypothetical protein BD626DRAFT_576426 [Schizophyllum amplum]|uniref:Uncharacterized protein n=1 Tax=Schizophyllum amplum TaxID=97359 RepID=A0A550BTR0_9AGAR|nr:hypothetical protein BD626DRAFT_576426 [Auriculariopsis ampla]
MPIPTGQTCLLQGILLARHGVAARGIPLFPIPQRLNHGNARRVHWESLPRTHSVIAAGRDDDEERTKKEQDHQSFPPFPLSNTPSGLARAHHFVTAGYPTTNDTVSLLAYRTTLAQSPSTIAYHPLPPYS